MKTFVEETEEKAVEAALNEFNIKREDLVYTVTDVSKKGFFKKNTSVTISCPDIQDLFEDVGKYISKIVSYLDVTCTYSFSYDGSTGIVVCKIKLDDDSKTSRVVGYRGSFLKCLNSVCRLFIQKRYNHDYRILLDCEGYKAKKYEMLTRLAHKLGHQVKTTRVDVKLDPMTSDERRIVHNVITNMNYVTSNSEGQGKDRHIVLHYDANKVVNNFKNKRRFNNQRNSDESEQQEVSEEAEALLESQD